MDNVNTLPVLERIGFAQMLKMLKLTSDALHRQIEKGEC